MHFCVKIDLLKIDVYVPQIGYLGLKPQGYIEFPKSGLPNPLLGSNFEFLTKTLKMVAKYRVGYPNFNSDSQIVVFRSQLTRFDSQINHNKTKLVNYYGF